MNPYADTNLFSRLYLGFPGSEEIAELFADAAIKGSAQLPVTWLHRMETLNAFQLYVFASKSGTQPRVTQEKAAAAYAIFQADLAELTFLRPMHIELSKLETQFEELALRHSSKYGFRTYDVLHVASALLLDCDTFWSFDPKASKLASLEGLKTPIAGR